MRMADSPWPMKGEAAATTASAPETPHGPVKGNSKLADKPLDDTPVVKDVDQGNEKDDCRKNTEEKETKVCNFGVGNKTTTILGKRQEFSAKEGNEFENIITGLGSQEQTEQ